MSSMRLLVTHGAKELIAQEVTHPGTSHSGRSLTSIYSSTIRVSTAPYHGREFNLYYIWINPVRVDI